MAPVIPNPKHIRAFKSDAAFDAWLRAHHARETEVWLRIYKKASGKPTVTHAQALDVALCWGRMQPPGQQQIDAANAREKITRGGAPNAAPRVLSRGRGARRP